MMRWKVLIIVVLLMILCVFVLRENFCLKSKENQTYLQRDEKELSVETEFRDKDKESGDTEGESLSSKEKTKYSEQDKMNVTVGEEKPSEEKVQNEEIIIEEKMDISNDFEQGKESKTNLDNGIILPDDEW